MLPFKEYHLQQLLNQFNSATPLDLEICQYFRANKALGSKDRKFIAETAYGMIRWLGLIDFHIKDKKTWEKRFEIFQNLNIKKSLSDESIPHHQRVSYPKILFDLLCKNFGQEDAIKIALNSNQRAPLTIRVNTSKISRDEFINRFEKEWEFTPCAKAPDGIRFNTHTNLFQTDAFKSGFFEVQDEASQLAARLVQAKPKQKVLDYCSGSGGKSLAFAPAMQGQGCIFVHDIRKGILTQAKKRFKRAGNQNYQIVEPDSKKLKQLHGNMDWVLVDTPCSGSGTYRRNPDLKWKFTQKMLDELVELQREIFDKAMKYLKPQGKIVYTTCSLLKEENLQQVEYFIDKYNLKLTSIPLNSSQELGTMDGFYGAVLERRPSDEI